MSQSIAVVDDEANIRETVAFALRREAYEVIAYADGLDAWTSFSDDKLPDLVILDIVKTRQALTREGYPHDNYVSERTIDSHVKRIRKKFESVDPEFDRIDTVYGMGYRYQPEAAGTK